MEGGDTTASFMVMHSRLDPIIILADISTQQALAWQPPVSAVQNYVLELLELLELLE